MYLAGNEDYKEICEDARLEDRAHFELITPRIYELIELLSMERDGEVRPSVRR